MALIEGKQIPHVKCIHRKKDYKLVAFQVVIVRKRKEYSRLFTIRKWGGKKRALAAAISWRDQLYVILDVTVSTLKEICSSNNLSTGVLGVCRTSVVDRRRIGHPRYLRYSVTWIDAEGAKHCKAFTVGNMNDIDPLLELKAFRSAKIFRADYELHCSNGMLRQFNPERHFDWRSQ